MKKRAKALLLILDGFGYRTEGDDNAILHAYTPNLDRLIKQYAFGILNASEEYVGLPKGQFGNSEVGHMTMGAGRLVHQDISRIDHDIQQHTFASNPVLAAAIEKAKDGHTLHILGLLSDGGVHSHENHIHALLRAAQQAGVSDIRIHAFLDGRDTPPRSAKQYLQRLNQVLQECPAARIVSLCGRYWAMDRDERWERLAPAAQLLIDGEAAFTAETSDAALSYAYERGEDDEFVQPTCIGKKTSMVDGDVIVFMNYRADRARQLTSALLHPNFTHFTIRQPAFSYFATLTSYGKQFATSIAYAPQKIHNGLGEYLASKGVTQLRIAETEKYPHVTYFFNGGQEQPYPGESRILIPSPKVATYDLQPQMSAFDVTYHVVKALHDDHHNVIICNYANGDMVGHTGNFNAAVSAVETLDQCIGHCVDALLTAEGEMLLTSDHGNCERMYDANTQQAHTQHTLNQVPLIYVGRQAKIRTGGTLKDIAPTLLAMMDITPPVEMTGTSLIDFQ